MGWSCETCGKALPVRRRFCTRACSPNLPKIPVTKEWLEHHYLTLGWDCPQIAKEVGRDTKRVWEWLKQFGIPTRSRGFGNGSRKTQRKKGESSSFKGKKHRPETIEYFKRLAIEQGRVPYHPEIGSYMKTAYGERNPNWKGGITPERQAFYLTEEWKEAVKFVWKRDNGICQRCFKDKRKHRGLEFHIHHVVSFVVKELRAEPSNLVLLCIDCHNWVHSNGNVEKDFIKELECQKKELAGN